MELIEKTVSDRILEAADDLYEKNGRSGFPLVDDVRKAAKANMNAVSQVMKKWRVQKLAQAAPAIVEVPTAVEQASRSALVALWQAAQQEASGALRAARLGWEAERLESDAVNAQTAQAYEAQSAALETAQAEIARLTAALEAAQQRHAEEAAQQRGEVVEQTERARKAKEELRAHTTASNARVEAARQQQEMAQESARERVEVAEQAAAQARESAARLEGQVQALEAQVAGYMRLLDERLATQAEPKSEGVVDPDAVAAA